MAIAKAEALNVRAVVEATNERERALVNGSAALTILDSPPHILQEINDAREASFEAARFAYIHRNIAMLHATAAAQAAALVVYRDGIDLMHIRNTYGVALANVSIAALTAADGLP